jgi:leucyl aminopeptidase
MTMNWRAACSTQARAVADPLWRMPLWKPYADMLDSDIADTANAGGKFRRRDHCGFVHAEIRSPTM